jgi:hypothetical protein
VRPAHMAEFTMRQIRDMDKYLDELAQPRKR